MNPQRGVSQPWTATDTGLRESAEYVTEDMALGDWCRLTGPQAMSMDLLQFLRDEVALRDTAECACWQKTLTRLCNRILRSGPPIEEIKDKCFRRTEQKARNAEEALLVVLNACALAREHEPDAIVRVDWPHPTCAGQMLHRLRGQRRLGVLDWNHLASGDQMLYRQGQWRLLGDIQVLPEGSSVHTVVPVCLGLFDLSQQILSAQELVKARLGGANLSETNFSEASLSGADLSKANLSGADLNRANLWRADLSGANLRRADLIGADLRGAKLEGASLRGADLSGALLDDANLEGADLVGTNLRGANLRGVRGLTEAQLDVAWGIRRQAPRLAAPAAPDDGGIGNEA